MSSGRYLAPMRRLALYVSIAGFVVAPGCGGDGGSSEAERMAERMEGQLLEQRFTIAGVDKVSSADCFASSSGGVILLDGATDDGDDGDDGGVACRFTARNGKSYLCEGATTEHPPEAQLGGTRVRLRGVICAWGSSVEPGDWMQVQLAVKAYAHAVDVKDAAAACGLSRASDCIRVTEEAFPKGGPVGRDFGELTRIRVSGDLARAYFSKGGFLALSKQDDVWKIDPSRSQVATVDPQ
jgi:hypothetical protein